MNSGCFFFPPYVFKVCWFFSGTAVFILLLSGPSFVRTGMKSIFWPEVPPGSLALSSFISLFYGESIPPVFTKTDALYRVMDLPSPFHR